MRGATMKRAGEYSLKFVWAWLQIAGGAVAAMAICWLAAQYAFHLRLLSVQTGSMRPSFHPHDALIMRRITPDQLRVGMVVSYRSSHNPNELVTHRVVRVTAQGFQTQGDALNMPDPMVQNSLLVGRVAVVLPRMGTPLDWLHTWPGLVACVYVPAAAIAISELRRMERSFARRCYMLHMPT
jgi:signal peptidase I